MDNMLNKLIDVLWLKPLSILISMVICLLVTINLLPNPIANITPIVWIQIIIYWCVVIGYSIAVWRHNRLPRAKEQLNSILFVIDAESNEYFKEVQKKLITEFVDNTEHGHSTKFEAICIEKSRLCKYKLAEVPSVLKLLNKVNCIMLVNIKHRVDSVTNCENCMLQIDYGLMHPEYVAAFQNLLQIDMHNLAIPIKRQSFPKTRTIDELAFTAQTLNVICEYVIGLALLLAACYKGAYLRFKSVQSFMATQRPERIIPGFDEVLKNRLYVACIKCIEDDFDCFYLNKDSKYLIDMNAKLEDANRLIPGTYGYYLSKAYYHVAFNSNIIEAKKCIAMCKNQKRQHDWKYSEAFLTAYEGHKPLSIYKKYGQAFRHDHDLLKIVDFIEYMLEKEPDRVSLHLAAGLVYSEIKEPILAQEHFDLYFSKISDSKHVQIKRTLTEKGIWQDKQAA